MKTIIKIVLGTCLMGFVNLAAMKADVKTDLTGGKGEAKSPKKSDAQKGSGKRKRSADSKFVAAMGSIIKAGQPDVITLHTNVVNEYQAILEDADENLRAFDELDAKECDRVIKQKEKFFKELDSLTQNEFVQVVKGLHELLFKTGDVAGLVKSDELDALPGTDKIITSKIIPTSVSRVIVWSDEYYIIEQFRAMANAIEAGEGSKNTQDAYEALIKNRLECCNFVDSTDGSVKHTNFPEDVQKIFDKVTVFNKKRNSPVATIVDVLRKDTDKLAQEYLVSVL